MLKTYRLQHLPYKLWKISLSFEEFTIAFRSLNAPTLFGKPAILIGLANYGLFELFFQRNKQSKDFELGTRYRYWSCDVSRLFDKMPVDDLRLEEGIQVKIVSHFRFVESIVLFEAICHNSRQHWNGGSAAVSLVIFLFFLLLNYILS